MIFFFFGGWGGWVGYEVKHRNTNTREKGKGKSANAQDGENSNKGLPQHIFCVLSTIAISVYPLTLSKLLLNIHVSY